MMPKFTTKRSQREDLSMSLVWNYGRARALANSLRRRAGCFVGDEAAGTMMIFALTIPVVMVAAGGAVDYSFAASTRSKMQAVADSAALASVRELQLARTDSSRVTVIANNVINSSLQGVTAAINVDLQAMTVQVVIEKQYTSLIGMASETTLRVNATAKTSGSMPLCLLGLNPSAPQTINLDHSALLTAPGCLVQSNSDSKQGLESMNSAVVLAGMICTAGGKSQTRNANFSPTPTTDCPALQDPLSARAAPPISACGYNNKVVDGGYENLQPGVYCGGLKLTNGAVGKLSNGIFIIKDGPLIVDSGASISGTEVGIYLKGSKANLTFDADSTIDLSAPKDGPSRAY
jgi:Flp pilus assembly protein TadG